LYSFMNSSRNGFSSGEKWGHVVARLAALVTRHARVAEVERRLREPETLRDDLGLDEIDRIAGDHQGP
jgi:hypothetical protein